eukprot:CAMPEP_0185851632 /NCGR_PEP_ID=MMETSP1354-20130828/10711_1 /TAXON_ID=708628 /ORGANISM="Erythrolobus madagascarensis, Strain CCMP3276" /LENGTH=774 /DNA_ID=CAMNT_0028552661 /DNA_START=333 /DNA_END=2657 /DNA_ORIENTATION=+
MPVSRSRSSVMEEGATCVLSKAFTEKDASQRLVMTGAIVRDSKGVVPEDYSKEYERQVLARLEAQKARLQMPNSHHIQIDWKSALESLKFASFGESWAVDVFSLPHNAIRRDLIDLYDMLESMYMRKRVLDVPLEIAMVFEWLRTFRSFLLRYFECEEQVLFPWIESRCIVMADMSRAVRLGTKSLLTGMLNALFRLESILSNAAAPDVVPAGEQILSPPRTGSLLGLTRNGNHPGDLLQSPRTTTPRRTNSLLNLSRTANNATVHQNERISASATAFETAAAHDQSPAPRSRLNLSRNPNGTPQSGRVGGTPQSGRVGGTPQSGRIGSNVSIQEPYQTAEQSPQPRVRKSRTTIVPRRSSGRMIGNSSVPNGLGEQQQSQAQPQVRSGSRTNVRAATIVGRRSSFNLFGEKGEKDDILAGTTKVTTNMVPAILGNAIDRFVAELETYLRQTLEYMEPLIARAFSQKDKEELDAQAIDFWWSGPNRRANICILSYWILETYGNKKYQSWKYDHCGVRRSMQISVYEKFHMRHLSAPRVLRRYAMEYAKVQPFQVYEMGHGVSKSKQPFRSSSAMSLRTSRTDLLREEGYHTDLRWARYKKQMYPALRYPPELQAKIDKMLQEDQAPVDSGIYQEAIVAENSGEIEYLGVQQHMQNEDDAELDMVAEHVGDEHYISPDEVDSLLGTMRQEDYQTREGTKAKGNNTVEKIENWVAEDRQASRAEHSNGTHARVAERGDSQNRRKAEMRARQASKSGSGKDKPVSRWISKLVGGQSA